MRDDLHPETLNPVSPARSPPPLEVTHTGSQGKTCTPLKDHYLPTAVTLTSCTPTPITGGGRQTRHENQKQRPRRSNGVADRGWRGPRGAQRPFWARAVCEALSPALPRANSRAWHNSMGKAPVLSRLTTQETGHKATRVLPSPAGPGRPLHTACAGRGLSCHSVASVTPGCRLAEFFVCIVTLSSHDPGQTLQ